MAAKLVVWFRPGCPWWAEVRELLEKHSIAYEGRDIVGNADHLKDMVDKTGQQKSPCLEVDGDILADAGAAEAEPFLVKRGLIGKGDSAKSSGGSCSLK